MSATAPLGDLILAAIRAAEHATRQTERYIRGDASRDAHTCATRNALIAANAMWTRLAQVVPAEETGVRGAAS